MQQLLAAVTNAATAAYQAVVTAAAATQAAAQADVTEVTAVTTTHATGAAVQGTTSAARDTGAVTQSSAAWAATGNVGSNTHSCLAFGIESAMAVAVTGQHCSSNTCRTLAEVTAVWVM